MSKLIDTLSNLGMAEPAPIGFGQQQTRQKIPLMLIVGKTARKKPLAKVAKSLDALLADGDLDIDQSPSGWKGIWGAALSNASPEGLDSLKEAGCDFVLVESGEAASLILRDDGMSRGLTLQHELTDRKARAIEDMPFEFLLIRAPDPSAPLTVEGVIELQETVSLFTKNIFLEVERLPDENELEALRDLPISALVINADQSDPKELENLRDAIKNLDPRERSEERSPLLPTAAGGVTGFGHPDYEEDDWSE